MVLVEPAPAVAAAGPPDGADVLVEDEAAEAPPEPLEHDHSPFRSPSIRRTAFWLTPNSRAMA